MKRIVWDWNGTLFDDIDLCLECINTLLRNHGLRPLKDIEAYREVFGFPIASYYQAVGFDFTETPFETLAQEYMSMYQQQSFTCSLVKDGLQSVQRAREMHWHQTILSASRKDYLLSQIQAMGMDGKVERVYGIEDIYASSKLDLAKRYIAQCDPLDEIWFVGDSLHDFEVSQQVGALCVLVTTGHQSRRRLMQSGAPVVDSLSKSLEVIYEGY